MSNNKYCIMAIFLIAVEKFQPFYNVSLDKSLLRVRVSENRYKCNQNSNVLVTLVEKNQQDQQSQWDSLSGNINVCYDPSVKCGPISLDN